MVFRLPTQLESFIPPPSAQARNSADTVLIPWRGLFLVDGTIASDIGSTVQIRVTGVETEGDTQSHLWPSRFMFSMTHAIPVLGQLQNYLKNRSPPIPITTFIPDRIRDANQNAVNQNQFRSLSRLLWDSQLVAVVNISLARSPISPSSREARHGILLFPAPNTSNVLLGAIFLASADVYPDFVYAAPQSLPAVDPNFASYDTSLGRERTSSAYQHPRNDPSSRNLSYSSRSQAHHQGDRRQSHSASPISPVDTHLPYRFMSPAPVMNIAHQSRAEYGQTNVYAEPSPYSSSISSYPPDSPAETGSGSGYQYSTQRSSTSGHPHSGYRQ